MTWKRLPCSSFPDDSFSCKKTTTTTTNNKTKQFHWPVRRRNEPISDSLPDASVATQPLLIGQRWGDQPISAVEIVHARPVKQKTNDLLVNNQKINKSIITKQRPNIKVILGFRDRYGHGLHFVLRRRRRRHLLSLSIGHERRESSVIHQRLDDVGGGGVATPWTPGGRPFGSFFCVFFIVFFLRSDSHRR